jgi:hypothetical protein
VAKKVSVNYLDGGVDESIINKGGPGNTTIGLEELFEEDT